MARDNVCCFSTSLDLCQYYSFFSGVLQGERAGTGVPVADYTLPSTTATCDIPAQMHAFPTYTQTCIHVYIPDVCTEMPGVLR